MIDGLVELNRGQATIPLPGIDVPFHSTFLRFPTKKKKCILTHKLCSSGVPAFRRTLRERMHASAIDPSQLIDRYIPNVVAVPFSLRKSYLELVQKATGSHVLAQVLNDWDVESKNPQQLAFTLVRYIYAVS